MQTKSNHFLFHTLLQKLRESGLQKRHFLIGVSGGLDSMTLLNVLLSLSPPLQLKISVVHVHHSSPDKKQRDFQDHAFKTVQDFCQKNQLTFYSNNLSQNPSNPRLSLKVSQDLPSSPLKNEADLRAFRYQVFLNFFKKSQADFLTLAHTAEDLLETQILRLIRGTGESGIIPMCFKREKSATFEAFSPLRENVKHEFLYKISILRPFIGLSRKDIKSYAKKMKLNWCEDPTNQLTHYSLRNWIRQEWLPALEDKKPGSLKAMARSLNLLTDLVHKEQSQVKKIAKTIIKKQGLRRDQLLTLPSQTRQKILVYYLKEQGIRNYSLNHIKEILKQLQREQKEFQFFLLKKTWKVNNKWFTCG